MNKKNSKYISKDISKKFNVLAREEMKLKLLADINIDLIICEIEWWDKKEFINDLKLLINNIGQKL